MKKDITADSGLGTIVNHYGHEGNSMNAHLMPIYQTSTFSFPDVETGGKIYSGQQAGYVYTRSGGPNASHLANKVAFMEGLDIVKASPETPVNELVAGKLTSSGLAASASAVLGRIGAGDTVITQRVLYGNTYRFWKEMAPRLGIEVVWVDNLLPEFWERAFSSHPEASLAYIETPANPTLDLVDIEHLAALAHEHDAWLMVDNTFATPYHQRPLTLGADVVVHSTTKYLSGHGQIIGGAIVSGHLDYMSPFGDGVGLTTKMLGVSPSPNDAWLSDIGLKTFELRMQRHSENGMAVAQYLSQHPKVDRVYYPGLENDPFHDLAKNQMFNGYGGMVAFELVGGYDAGVGFANAVSLATLAVSLGNVDTLIQHPASMTHLAVPEEERLKAGITDGLIRLSLGIENCEDILADIEKTLDGMPAG